MKVTPRNYPLLGFLLTLLVVSPLFHASGEETIEDIKHLVKREGIFFKKFSDVPFDGEVIGGRHKGFIQNGKKEGSWLTYFENGQLKEKSNFIEGAKDGLEVRYFKNGILSANINFKNGIRDGSWITYYTNGQLYYEGNYKNGERDGSWVFYFDNGQLMSKGEYEKGLREGAWVRYWQWGPLKNKGEYSKDKNEGVWTYCDQHKLVDQTMSGKYSNGVKIDEVENVKC